MLAIMFAAALTSRVLDADTAAVRDAESRWSAAFLTGDTANLSALLVDGYVSVDENGVDHPKAAIIAAAASYAAAHPGEKPQPMPPSSTIAIEGDLALVRHRDSDHVSVDVFQKQAGVWRAVYSQHTHAAPPR